MTYHSRRSDKLGAGIHGWMLEKDKPFYVSTLSTLSLVVDQAVEGINTRH